jgi:hypothetical protein
LSAGSSVCGDSNDVVVAGICGVVFRSLFNTDFVNKPLDGEPRRFFN